MATITKDLREYRLFWTEGGTSARIAVYDLFEEQKSFSNLPNVQELEMLFGVSGLIPDVHNCFMNAVNMTVSPRLPANAYDSGTYSGLYEAFLNCPALVIPPKLPAVTNGTYCFEGCTAMLQGAVLPAGMKNIQYMYRYCSSLLYPVSIPSSVTNVRGMYTECSNMTGEMIVRATPTTYTDMFKDTTKPITLYGNQSTCNTLAATANNNNVSWSAWYAPVPAVTDRGEGSHTTATDITRMVRNGALAVSSYAPGRMVYNQGDIVREDEWNALVEAAQTIDPTVTLSTHYTNLNKIEKAFDDAL